MKKKSNLSCWEWKHPFRSIKNSWWRITKGFCPSDTWDWYTYQANLIHDTMLYWAVNLHSTPFGNEENWSEQLEAIARKLLIATNWEDTYDNPFKEKFLQTMGSIRFTKKEDGSLTYDFPEVDPDLYEHYVSTNEQNYIKAKKEVRESLEWLADNWFDLWD